MCHLKQNKTETHSQRRVATRKEEDFGGGEVGEGGELYVIDGDKALVVKTLQCIPMFKLQTSAL